MGHCMYLEIEYLRLSNLILDKSPQVQVDHEVVDSELEAKLLELGFQAYYAKEACRYFSTLDEAVSWLYVNIVYYH